MMEPYLLPIRPLRRCPAGWRAVIRVRLAHRRMRQMSATYAKRD